MIVYGDVIGVFQNHLSGLHALVLHMWSNYKKYWDKDFILPPDFLSRCHELYLSEERKSGEYHDETLVALHVYGYAAYYNARNKELAEHLFSIQFERSKEKLRSWQCPWWCLISQGFSLAAMVLSTVRWQKGKRSDACEVLEEAIDILRRGDVECQIRATMLIRMLRKRLGAQRNVDSDAGDKITQCNDIERVIISGI
jgi:hypothetical protein